MIVREEVITINDGAFVYPVSVEDVVASGATLEALRQMDGDEYSAWCQEVPVFNSLNVGSQECIDVCNDLIGHGAECWSIA